MYFQVNVGIVLFGDDAQVELELSSDEAEITNAINNLP